MNCRAHGCRLCLTSVLHSLLYFFLVKCSVPRYLSLLSRHTAAKWGSWSLCFAPLRLRLAIYLNLFCVWATHRQTTFAVPVGNSCVLPTTASLNASVLVVVVAASGLFHNSVLVAAPSESCSSALVTVSKLLKLMTRLVVMFASMSLSPRGRQVI